jgi:hypothetical protein
MIAMIQLNVVVLHHPYAAEQCKPRTRKMPTLRGLLLLIAVEGPSERCGAYATDKPKRTVGCGGWDHSFVLDAWAAL